MAKLAKDSRNARDNAESADAASRSTGTGRAASSANDLIGAHRTARVGSNSAGSGNASSRNASSARSADNLMRGHVAQSRSGKVLRPAEQTRSNQANGSRQQVRRMTLFEFIAHNAVYIVGVAAVVAITTVLLMAVRSCVPTAVYDYDGELDFEYESPFDWNNLDMSTSRYAYVSNGKTLSHLGIDVSENQGSIDWKAVRADGVEFAMIRAGYRGATRGDLYADELFAENLENAHRAGIDCGVYFFSQAKNAREAWAEADFVIKQLDGTQLEYPIAFDFESTVAGVESPRTAGLGKDQMTEIVEAFCNCVSQAGYQPMVYGNYYDLVLYHYDYLEDKNIWWAEYDVSVPNPNLDITMWQYANDGWVDGISTVVDMNLDLSEAI